MLAVEGIFDGESVKFSEPVNFQKNQRVLVTLAEDSANFAEKDLFMEALLTNSLVIKTDLKADEYIRELRENDRTW